MRLRIEKQPEKSCWQWEINHKQTQKRYEKKEKEFYHRCTQMKEDWRRFKSEN